MTELRHQMLPVYAKALGLGPENLLGTFQEHALHQYRLAHYTEPPRDEKSDEDAGEGEDSVFGIAPHADATFFTILAPNEVQGLSIRLRSGEWVPVPAIPGAFLVNTGEILHRFTNGRF